MITTSDIAVELARQIKKQLPAQFPTHTLHQPFLRANESAYVQDCINSNWVSSVGQYVDRFEKDLAAYTGARFAVATMNGTAALHIASIMAGIGAEDEVLMPSLSFVASANALRYCQAIPHFIDVAEQMPNVCAEKLASYLQKIAVVKSGVCYNKFSGRVIRALMVVHVLGHPADLAALKKLCAAYHLALVEDAAEALGSFYQGSHVGHAGLVGALSFNGNKIMTTGGGGALLTNDADIARRAKHITTTGKIAHAWKFQHDCVAYNYRLPNINAAMGCAQLEKIDFFLQSKRQLLACYQKAVAELDVVQLLHEPEKCRSNYWLHALIVKNHDSQSLLAQLHAQKIAARPVWQLIHTMPMYRDCPRMSLTASEQWANQLIQLPSSVWLEEK